MSTGELLCLSCWGLRLTGKDPQNSRETAGEESGKGPRVSSTKPDLQTTMRREVADHELSPYREGMDPLDETERLDLRDARQGHETPQEAHERMIAEDAATETVDLLQGLRELQGGESVVWSIFRIAGSRGEPLPHAPTGEYCGVLGTSQLTQENIASLFGGGRYKVRGRFANGTFAKERRITIAADVKRAEPDMPVTAQAPFNMQEFMALQDAKEERNRERAKRDRMELIAIMGPIVAPILAAMVGKPAPAVDLPALITALRPAPGENPRTAMKDTLEIMTMMSGFMGGGGSDTAEILKAVGGIAGPAIQAFAASKAAAPRPRQNLPRPPAPGAQPTVVVPAEPLRVETAVPQGPQPAPVRQPVVLDMDRPTTVQPNSAAQTGADLSQPSEVLTPQEQAMFTQVKPQVEMLIGIARNGGDPVETADMFFETALMPLPDDNYAMACEFLEHPKFLDRAALFSSELNQYRDFFVKFQARVVQRIKIEAGEEATPG